MANNAEVFRYPVAVFPNGVDHFQNKIIVVDNGNIIEFGSPQELMEKKGKYYRLVQIQSMSDKVAQSRRDENFD